MTWAYYLGMGWEMGQKGKQTIGENNDEVKLFLTHK
jgi:hypothetical protein